MPIKDLWFNIIKKYKRERIVKRVIIAKVTTTKNRIFLLNIEMNVLKCLNICVKGETWLWHMRLWYVNFDSLKMMAQKEMLKGLPSIIHPNQLCGGCLVWASNFQRVFRKSQHQEHINPNKKYMLMFVVLSNHVCLVKIYIFYFLLMLIVEKLRYTS